VSPLEERRRRRRSEESTLYRVVQENLDTLYGVVDGL
jgi:hypothetical protein